MSGNKRGMTLFQMLRDVLIASLNRGQFPVAIMGLTALVAVCRMPAADLTRLIFRLLDAAEAHEYGGYALTAAIAVSWAISGKRQRHKLAVEFERLSDERNRFQRIALDGQIKSSRRGR